MVEAVCDVTVCLPILVEAFIGRGTGLLGHNRAVLTGGVG